MKARTGLLTRWLASFIAAFALLCNCGRGQTGATGATGAAGPPAVDLGTIAGTVQDGTGAPIAGVAVATVPATNAGTSAANGQFTIASVPIGVYQVTAQRSGYSSAQVNGVGVVAGASVQVTLVLTATAPMTGAVSGTINVSTLLSPQGIATPTSASKAPRSAQPATETVPT